MRVHRLNVESVTVESFTISPLGSPNYSTYVIADGPDSADPCAGVTEIGYATSPGLTCGASCGCP